MPRTLPRRSRIRPEEPRCSAAGNVALRRQIAVLQRSAKKRLRLQAADRLLWVWLSRVWTDWRSSLVIVKPETVIAWHRKAFCLFWSWKIRRGKPGARRSPVTFATSSDA